MNNLWHRLSKILIGVSSIIKKNSNSNTTELAKQKIDEAQELLEKQYIEEEYDK